MKSFNSLIDNLAISSSILNASLGVDNRLPVEIRFINWFLEILFVVVYSSTFRI